MNSSTIFLFYSQTKIWSGRCVLLALVFVQLSLSSTVRTLCQHSGNGGLRYMWGDALRNPDCLGPNGLEYPKRLVESIVTQSVNVTLRQKREVGSDLSWDSERLRLELLNRWLLANGNANLISTTSRKGKKENLDGTKNCLLDSGSRLCETEYNTTAPLFGVSMTSGDTVAIVQKFPDLLQQVVYEKCLSKILTSIGWKSQFSRSDFENFGKRKLFPANPRSFVQRHDECKLLRGECHQTYVPYLLLTVPLGPVTLTGQDYILVESGCVCQMNNRKSN